MKLGELSLDIVVKGGEKTKEVLTGVDRGLKGVASSGLAAKASIVAAVYGIQELLSASAKLGAGLIHNEDITGIPAAFSQKWALAAEIAHGSSDQMVSDIGRVQDAAVKILKGAPHPEGYDVFAMNTGLTQEMLKDPQAVLQKIREFAEMTKGQEGFGNSFLDSLVSRDTIGVFRNKDFAPEKIKDSDILSPNLLGSLGKLDSQLVRLKNTLKNFGAEQSSKYGGGLLGALTKDVETFIRVVRGAEGMWGSFAKNNKQASEGIKLLGEALTLYLAPVLGILAPALTGFIALDNVLGAVRDYEEYKAGKRSFFGEPLDAKGQPIGGPSFTHQVADFLSGMVLRPNPTPGGSPINVNVDARGATKDDADHIGRSVKRHLSTPIKGAVDSSPATKRGN
jgi:hypothetical protein